MAEPVYRNIGNSRTLPEPRGKTIAVLPPDDVAYLCKRICLCECRPLISSKGRQLKQRCVTVSVRNDCDYREQVWKYKGEVGYNMINNPPSPIMAALKRNQPFQFPLGMDTKALEEAIDLAKLTGRAQKGLLRIPDVVIVKDRRDFDLSQRNIECVVEIKFPGDRWQTGQERAYVQIAGDQDRLKLLSPATCSCKSCDKPETTPEMVTLPEKTVVPDMTRRLARIREHNALVGNGVLPGPKHPEPTTLVNVLETGATVVGALAIAYVAVVAGPPLLVLLVVGGAATAAAQ
ncbi:VRR-NUC domain-containing protein [Paraburkholderia flava]|uniref:VRR-NUC domain-containing protein n=1 Tax=Paraburkholderia flava TaxID=2547393 RepID=UPI00105F5948|nr:VRR-NUC domain-containing protein [Paraburkholderia flava]